MYYALDVAKYIITYSNQKGYKINNLKLQKLLYYVQAFFLIKTEKACFKEDMAKETPQEKNNMKLGQFLRQQRISKGFPLYKVAELSGIDIIHISDIERCRVLPSEEECQALSSLYECAVNMQDFDLETVSRKESIFIFKDDCSTINEAQSNYTMK